MRKVVLHCSDSDYEGQSASWIARIHIEERGWDDIGYHYFIRKSGLIEVGRPLDIVGSHVYGHNSDSVGVCLAGRSDFSQASLTSLSTVLLPLLKRVYPGATLHGHREFSKTKSCPIFDYSDLVRAWNRGVNV